jgi:hypothetical protein
MSIHFYFLRFHVSSPFCLLMIQLELEETRQPEGDRKNDVNYRNYICRQESFIYLGNYYSQRPYRIFNVY